MGWYALEEIQNAVDDTKDLLFPFNWKTWAKIALIAVFLGGSSMNIPFPSGPTSYDSGDMETGTSYSESLQSFSDGGLESVTGMATGAGEASLALLAVALLIPVALIFMLMSSVARFVLYQSLMDSEVKILDNVNRHFGRSFRFFLANIGLTLLVLGGFLGFIAVTVVEPILGILALVAAIPVFVIAGFSLKLFTEFVPLKMMEEEVGVIAGLKSFLSDAREEWKQVLIYLLVSIGVGIGTGIVSLIGLLMTAVAVFIPFGVIAFIAGMAADVLAGVFLIIGLLVWALTMMYFVSGPITTFLNYYVIRVYHRLTA